MPAADATIAPTVIMSDSDESEVELLLDLTKDEDTPSSTDEKTKRTDSTVVAPPTPSGGKDTRGGKAEKMSKKRNSRDASTNTAVLSDVTNRHAHNTTHHHTLQALHAHHLNAIAP